MRKSVVIAIAALMAILAASVMAAQETEIPVKSSIGSVVVYSDRAVVERTAKLDLPAGRSTLVFESLPERLDPNSLQARGQGALVLEDSVFRTKYLTAIPDERIKAMEAERDQRQAAVQDAIDRRRRSESEKAFLEKIVSKVTSAEEGSTALDPDKWVQMTKFYREKLVVLDAEIRAAEKDEKAQRAELERIQRELSALSAGRQKRQNQALLVVRADRAVTASLSLSYVVAGPSWSPVYDIRVDSEKRTLSIAYNAYITQNTGEDWNGVNLSLSTARPEIGGSQPELDPWFIRIYKPAPVQQSSRAKAATAPMLEAKEDAAQMYNAFPSAAAPAPEPEALMDFAGAEAKKGAVAVVFAIKGATSIQSDSAKHRVTISQSAFGAAFRYSSVPKLSPYAYLKAQVRNESDFPFLPGPSKVFLDGNFVAEAKLDLVAPGEEFWTYLGVDESVKVDYKLLKKYKDEQGVFEKKNRYVYQYETVVTNKKGVDVELVLWDQLPVSTDQKLVVKLIDPKYQKDSDSLKKNSQDMFEWLLSLKPGESRKIGFSYSVEYPQDYLLEGL